MKKEIYDNVGIISVQLNEKLNELKACQTEKEAILKWVDELNKQNALEENAKLIRNKMAENLEKFKKVVAEIEELNKKTSN